MLPAWATVVLTLGAVLLTGLFGVVVPFVQDRLRAKHEASQVAEARRRESLRLAITIGSVAEQAKLDHYIVNTREEHYEHLQALSRTLAEAREPLLALT